MAHGVILKDEATGLINSNLRNSNTSARNYSLQDRDGTIADLVDVSTVTQTTVSVAATLDATAFGKLHILTGTSYTLVLPTAASNTGKSIAFKGASTLSGAVTIDGAGTETIDGSLTISAATLDFYVLTSDGAGYIISSPKIGVFVDYVPTWGGFSVAPTGVTARYSLVGKMCTVIVAATANGTSNALTSTITLPFNAKTGYIQQGTCIALINNGTVTAPTGFVSTRSGSNVCDVYRDPLGTAWSNVGGKRFAMNFTYEID